MSEARPMTPTEVKDYEALLSKTVCGPSHREARLLATINLMAGLLDRAAFDIYTARDRGPEHDESLLPEIYKALGRT